MSDSEIRQLFAATLSADYEDEEPWEAVRKLRHLGSRQVFDVAKEWCESSDPRRRARGVDVIAQLGKTGEHPTNSYPEESYALVSRVIGNEQSLRPLSSAIAALGHLDDSRGIPLIAQHAAHESADIRFSVAFALGSFPNDSVAVATLLALMRDTDEDVRDWATFGLGVLGDQDSTEIREELRKALQDANEDVREEALVALAKRHDASAVTPVLAALGQKSVSSRIIEAAYTLLDFTEVRTDWELDKYAEALKERYSR